MDHESLLYVYFHFCIIYHNLFFCSLKILVKYKRSTLLQQCGAEAETGDDELEYVKAEILQQVVKEIEEELETVR